MVSTDFLAQALQVKRTRLAHLQARPLEELRAEALAARSNARPHLLRAAIARADRINVIAEIKRASPSQGVIREKIEPGELALAYSRGGAAAISVLTEEDYFRGSLDDLRSARGCVSLPLLRRDIIIEPCQVYETAIVGADALSLIAAALDEKRFALLRRITEEELGMDALVEVHSSNEMLWAHALGAVMVGVSNRSWATLKVSFDVSTEVSRVAPENVLLVTENGLRTGKHLRSLRALGFKGFLIGEALMRGDRPEEALRDLLCSA
jgi:indole-3-glycerol phosphate synthase